MTKKDKSTPEDDIALFHKAMKDVKPIKTTPLYPGFAKPDENSLYRRFAAAHFIQPRTEEYSYVASQRRISLPFCKNGIQHKLLQKMKRGQLTLDDCLDLHGFNPATAWKRISIFIQEAPEAGIRHALIVHGKGSGKLKNELLNWLYDDPAVLACCEAGAGAVRILIKTPSQ